MYLCPLCLGLVEDDKVCCSLVRTIEIDRRGTPRYAGRTALKWWLSGRPMLHLSEDSYRRNPDILDLFESKLRRLK